MGYDNTPPADQWTREDLDRAHAAGDHEAITAALKAGHLHNLTNPQAEAPDAERLAQVLAPPAGPTVPNQVPGGQHTYGSGAQMTRDELDRLSAAGDHDAINEARRTGRLRHVMGA